jgi:hypothetical protein
MFRHFYCAISRCDFYRTFSVQGAIAVSHISREISLVLLSKIKAQPIIKKYQIKYSEVKCYKIKNRHVMDKITVKNG